MMITGKINASGAGGHGGGANKVGGGGGGSGGTIVIDSPSISFVGVPEVFANGGGGGQGGGIGIAQNGPEVKSRRERSSSRRAEMIRRDKAVLEGTARLGRVPRILVRRSDRQARTGRWWRRRG